MILRMSIIITLPAVWLSFFSFTYLITWFFVWVCFCFCKWFRMIKFKLLHWYLHSWSKLVLKYGPMHCKSSRKSTLHKQACLCNELYNHNSGYFQEDVDWYLTCDFIKIGQYLILTDLYMLVADVADIHSFLWWCFKGGKLCFSNQNT